MSESVLRLSEIANGNLVYSVHVFKIAPNIAYIRPIISKVATSNRWKYATTPPILLFDNTQ